MSTVAPFEIFLRQERVLIPQIKILQREYRKRELAVPFSFWSVFILTSNMTMLQCDNTTCN